MLLGTTCGPLNHCKKLYKGKIFYFCDLHGPTRHTLRTPWGPMDHRLRTYALTDVMDWNNDQFVIMPHINGVK